MAKAKKTRVNENHPNLRIDGTLEEAVMASVTNSSSKSITVMIQGKEETFSYTKKEEGSKIFFTVFQGTYDLGEIFTPKRHLFAYDKFNNVQETAPSKNDSIRDIIEEEVLKNEGLLK